jgi:uncharacterized membrane-anchored protein
MYCQKCGAEIQYEEAEICPSCGVRIVKTENNKCLADKGCMWGCIAIWAALTILFGLFMFVLTIIGFISGNSNPLGSLIFATLGVVFMTLGWYIAKKAWS